MLLPIPLLRFVALLAALAFGRGLPAQPLPEFSADAMLGHVKHLASQELRGRAAGTAGERKAAEHIATRLEERGVRPPRGGQRLQPVPFPGGPAGEPGESVNVLGWIDGARDDLKEEVIVLGAHLDHLGALPAGLHLGADDNASGVAVLIEIAVELEKNAARLGRSVIVAFFGAEEAEEKRHPHNHLTNSLDLGHREGVPSRDPG
jgi:hypothetical protein